MQKAVPTIELTDFLINFEGTLLEPFSFSVSAGEFWMLEADLPEKAQLFFQALATLTAPTRGTYRLSGQLLDFSNYQCLLTCKKQIGYISPAISLISNRTIRENLMLTSYCRQDKLYMPLAPEIESMCRQFDLTHKLDRRATESGQWDLRTGLVIRELNKNPSILLVDRPEEMVPLEKRSLLALLLNEQAASGKPLIFYSRHQNYIDNFSPTGKIEMRQNKISIKKNVPSS